jgi:PRA1 family protein 1
LADLVLITLSTQTAPEATQLGDHVVTQKHLYTGLFVIGIPMLWIASPFSTFFWVVGASGFLIIGHASFLEPGVESDYAAVQDTV